MPNLRFLPKPTVYTIAQLAKICGCSIHNNEYDNTKVTGVNTLSKAQKNELSFLTNSKYKSEFVKTSASVCVISKEAIEYAPEGMALLISDNPHASYAIAASKIFEGFDDDIFGDELISKNAKIGQGCQIAKNCEIADGAEIGDNVIIHNFVRIGRNVKIGSGSVIKSGAVITHTVMGKNCLIYTGVKVGQEGFGYAPSSKGVIRVPQLGGVILGDGVELGANTTIDRGALDDTMVGDHTKIDNLVQLGHNVKVGKFCFIAAQAGIAGSTEIGDQVMIGGQAGTNGHIKIGSKAQIAGKSGVISSVDDGAIVGGYPAVNMKTWFRMTAKLKQLVEKKVK